MQSILNQVRYLELSPLTGLRRARARIDIQQNRFYTQIFSFFWKSKVFCVKSFGFGQSWVVLSWFHAYAPYSAQLSSLPSQQPHIYCFYLRHLLDHFLGNALFFMIDFFMVSFIIFNYDENKMMIKISFNVSDLLDFWDQNWNVN